MWSESYGPPVCHATSTHAWLENHVTSRHARHPRRPTCPADDVVRYSSRSPWLEGRGTSRQQAPSPAARAGRDPSRDVNPYVVGEPRHVTSRLSPLTSYKTRGRRSLSPDVIPHAVGKPRHVTSAGLVNTEHRRSPQCRMNCVIDFAPVYWYRTVCRIFVSWNSRTWCREVQNCARSRVAITHALRGEA